MFFRYFDSIILVKMEFAFIFRHIMITKDSHNRKDELMPRNLLQINHPIDTQDEISPT